MGYNSLMLDLNRYSPVHVGVLGDLHANTRWTIASIEKLCTQLDSLSEPRPWFFLQAGDFGAWDDRGGWNFLQQVNLVLAAKGAVIAFVPGNHENYNFIESWADWSPPGCPNIYQLPRGYRWRWHDRTWLALGGAVSPDKSVRSPQIGWFPQETITYEQAEKVCADGPANVMITHDCFSKETLVATRKGFTEIGSLAGQKVDLLTSNPAGKGSAIWVPARIYSRGIQPLLKLTLTRNRIPSKIIYTTAGHRWITIGHVGTKNRNRRMCRTTELRSGDRLARWMIKSFSEADISPAGVQAGIVYGDGTIRGDAANVDLYDNKKQLLSWFADYPHTVLKTPEGGDFYQIKCLPRFFNELPPLNEARSYLAGWLAGYIATDGHVTTHGAVALYSSDRQSLEHAQACAMMLGLGTGDIGVKKSGKDSYGDKGGFVLTFWREMFPPTLILRTDHRASWDSAPKPQRFDWIVKSVESTDRVEEVFCPAVPTTETFVIDGHILTGNCPTGVPLHYMNPPPSCFAPEDLRRSEQHRQLLRSVVNEIEPEYLIHGHYHQGYPIWRKIPMSHATMKVASLHMDGDEGNRGILNVQTMEWV